MFFTGRSYNRTTLSAKILLLPLLLLLLLSCSPKDAEERKSDEEAKNRANQSIATKKKLISKTIELLIAIQNRINTHERKYGNLPNMDQLGSSYDMWKGRVEFSLMKKNPNYNYMLQSKGPDGKKNTDDDIRIINNVAESTPQRKKTTQANSSTENLVERLGAGEPPADLSLEEMEPDSMGEGGMEISLEDFEKMAGEGLK